MFCPFAGLLACAAYLVSDAWLMLLLFNAALFCVVAYPGISAAALQIATPPELRGKLSSVYLIGLNLLGSLSGPMIVAAITQYGFGDDARVGWSMSIFAAGMMALATLFCLLGKGPMRATIAARS
jgi:MFS family permease